MHVVADSFFSYFLEYVAHLRSDTSQLFFELFCFALNFIVPGSSELTSPVSTRFKPSVLQEADKKTRVFGCADSLAHLRRMCWLVVKINICTLYLLMYDTNFGLIITLAFDTH